MPLSENSEAVPIFWQFSSVPAYSSPPPLAQKVEPNLRPVAPHFWSEYVYRWPTAIIPKFSQPDLGEFFRLHRALENLVPRFQVQMGLNFSNTRS